MESCRLWGRLLHWEVETLGQPGMLFPGPKSRKVFGMACDFSTHSVFPLILVCHPGKLSSRVESPGRR